MIIPSIPTHNAQNHLRSSGSGSAGATPTPPGELELVILHTSVPTSLNDFVVKVDMADMPTVFWNNVETDGGSIRVKDSDGAFIPTDMVHIDTDNQRGLLYFKGDLSSSVSNTFRIAYSGTDLDLLPVDDPLGRDEVWADYEIAVVGPFAVDRTGNNTILSSGAVTNYELKEIARSPDTDANQGIAYGGSNYYVTSTNTLKKYDSTWTLLTSNSDPVGEVNDREGIGNLNHAGDLAYIDGELYIPIEEFPATPYDSQYIGVFNVSNLALDRVIDISGGGREASSVCEGTNGTLFVTDYTSGSSIPYYDKTTGAYEGELVLSETIPNIQGITCHSDGTFYVSEDVNDQIYKIDVDGTVESRVLYENDLGVTMQGLGVKDDNLLVLIDNAADEIVLELTYDKSHWFRFGGGNGTIRTDNSSLLTDYTVTTQCMIRDPFAQTAIISYNNGGSTFTRSTLLFDDFTTDRIAIWNDADSWLTPLSTVDPATYTDFHLGYSHSTTTGRQCWVDGTLNGTAGSTTQRPSNISTDFMIGAAFDTGAGDPVNGVIEYATLRSGVLSDDWLAVEAFNHKDPSTFYTITEA